MSNMLFSPSSGIFSKIWTTGLSNYVQSNCQVTLTDNGLRIYRPPNLTVADNGNTMWGGMRLINSTNSNINHTFDSTDNFFGLIQNHTYIIEFHVAGQSSNTFGTFGWFNQMGWGGGGLSPSPSNVVSHGIPSNFQGETDCFYKFTVNDTISKTCTTTYSYATAGNIYLSYTHFGVGFQYTSTGTLGTDIYITNLRMYDITNDKINITKTGILYPTGIIEQTVPNTKILSSQEAIGNIFYEY